MAVRTATQVVSQQKRSEVTQRRLFRKKALLGETEAGTPTLPSVPSTFGSKLPQQKEVSDLDRVVSLKSYKKRIEDDTKAYECWLASWSQFGEDVQLQRRARIIRRDRPDIKKMVNKVYACWLEPGDSWGDPDYSRHRTSQGYPTREKYEQRSSYSAYKRHRLRVVADNPSKTMLELVWNNSKMSSFPLGKGLEIFHRPPTLEQLYSRVPWSREPLVSSEDKLTNGLYATPANDPVESIVSGTEEKVNVTINGTERAVYHPVEHHRKQFEWFEAQSNALAQTEALVAPKPVLDEQVIEEKTGIKRSSQGERFVLNAGSGFKSWSNSSRMDSLRYERYWNESDENRYQYWLASRSVSSPRIFKPRSKVHDSYDAMLNFYEYNAAIGRFGPERVERIRQLVSLRENRAEKLNKLLEGAKFYPVVAVGEPYGDYDIDVKKLAVKFGVHPSKVEAVMKSVDSSEPMSDEEYDEVVNLDEVVSATAEKISSEYMKASYTSELGLEYLSVNGILVPRNVADNRPPDIKVVKTVREAEEAIDVVLQSDGVYGPPAPEKRIERTPAERAGLKPWSEMTRVEKVVDKLKDWGILSV